MFDAVVFDLDGTLVDTESLTQAAGIEAFAESGIQVDPAFLHGLIGKDDQTGAALSGNKVRKLEFLLAEAAAAGGAGRGAGRGCADQSQHQSRPRDGPVEQWPCPDLRWWSFFQRLPYRR